MLSQKLSKKSRETIFIILLLIVPLFGSSAVALFIGLIVAFTIGNPFVEHNKVFTKILLQASVVGLGFGMNIGEALEAGKTGFMFTLVSIAMTMGIGLIAGKWLKVNPSLRTLISGGTAICGGSAIAALGPVIKAKDNDMTVALGTVFTLNAAALFLFPALGNLLGMSDTEFGYWCAIAIHDTSSVVGAAAERSQEALEIATTTKLIRALWIIPLSLTVAVLWNRQNNTEEGGKGKISIPWFIFLYVLAMVVSTYIFPLLPFDTDSLKTDVVKVAKMGMIYTLFLIGSGMSWASLKEVGLRPILLGITLWIIISVVSAATIPYIV